MSMKIQARELPWLLPFEWHPEERRVYVVRGKNDANAIAENVRTPEEAAMVVRGFVSGYQTCQRGPNVRAPVHHHLKIPTIHVGAKQGAMGGG